MKSQFEKAENEEKELNSQRDSFESGDQYDPDASEAVEVENSAPDVASLKGSKTIVLVASAVLITVVLYFFFFREHKPEKVEKVEEVITTPATNNGGPAKAEVIDDFPAEEYILEKPKEPELPKLPELPKDAPGQGFSGVLPTFIDLPKEQLNPSANVPAATAQAVNGQNQQEISAADKSLIKAPAAENAQNAVNPVPAEPAKPTVMDLRKSPIIVVGGTSGESKGGTGDINSSSIAGVGYESNIVLLKENDIDKLKKTEVKITPTMVANMPNTIIQGKILTAVLETAISTELPGNVRAVVSRDVYAEAGNNILIPKGSRLYGSYSSDIVRGQARVQISWTRLIRPDGVDMNITFNASDQFGRSGIDGEVDNKYGSIIGNSILTSILAVSGAIAAERLAGGSSTSTTTTDALGNVTSTGQASNKLIYDASKSIIDTVGQVIGNAIDTRPIIRVAQGTRITIIANADITLPAMRKTKKIENGYN